MNSTSIYLAIAYIFKNSIEEFASNVVLYIQKILIINYKYLGQRDYLIAHIKKMYPNTKKSFRRIAEFVDPLNFGIYDLLPTIIWISWMPIFLKFGDFKDSDSRNDIPIIQFYTLFIFRHQLENFICAVTEKQKYDENNLISCIEWNPQYRNMYKANKIYKRSFDNIFIDKSIYEQIDKELNRNKYSKFNNVSKHVMFLHGAPGTGKTSTILGFASKYNKDIITVTRLDHCRDAWNDLFRYAGNRYIIVIEDLDYLITNPDEDEDDGDEDEDKKNDNLAYKRGIANMRLLLNVFDGLNTVDGMTIFITANNIKKLPKALYRSKRCDCLVEFKLPDAPMIRRMINAMCPELPDKENFIIGALGNGMSHADIIKKLID